MEKRGLGFISIIFAVVIAALLTAGIYFFFIREDSTEILNKGMDKDANTSNNQTLGKKAVQCSDYTNKEDCQLDSYKVGACSADAGKCNCIWDANTSSCKLNFESSINKTINQTEDTELIVDLKAINLRLDKGDCVNVINNATNSTTKNCTINIMGTIKNLGTNTIETDFVVHFIDVTTGSFLIKLVTVSDSIVSQEEKNITASKGGVGTGEYWVQFVVDASKKIAEKDEKNNFLTEAINV